MRGPPTMTCLSDGVCSHMRQALVGEALRWWQEHEAKLRELTRGELEAFARSQPVWTEGLPSAVALRVSVAWRQTDLEGWRAWRNATTATLAGVARRRAEAKAALLDAIMGASTGILRTIGAILRRCVGL